MPKKLSHSMHESTDRKINSQEKRPQTRTTKVHLSCVEYEALTTPVPTLGQTRSSPQGSSPPPTTAILADSSFDGKRAFHPDIYF